jgi:hypothetical protein
MAIRSPFISAFSSAVRYSHPRAAVKGECGGVGRWGGQRVEGFIGHIGPIGRIGLIKTLRTAKADEGTKMTTEIQGASTAKLSQ